MTANAATMTETGVTLKMCSGCGNIFDREELDQCGTCDAFICMDCDCACQVDLDEPLLSLARLRLIIVWRVIVYRTGRVCSFLIGCVWFVVKYPLVWFLRWYTKGQA